MLKSDDDIAIRSKLEVVGNYIRLVFADLVIICPALLYSLEVPYKVRAGKIVRHKHACSAYSQVMTKGPVDVTMVFSSSLTPVLNLQE